MEVYIIEILHFIQMGIITKFGPKRKSHKKERVALVEEVLNIYKKPLPSFRTGLFYNTYPYPTKIAPESIAVYIASHTNPGDTVLDAFAGSGSTALAALMCEHPTNQMKELAERVGAKPKWGARNAVLYEISTYGALASRVMTSKLKASEFRNAANEVLEKVQTSVGRYYDAIDPEGNRGSIRHVVWTSVLVCPHCDEEITYFDSMVQLNPVRISSEGFCPKCGKQIVLGNQPNACSYSKEDQFDIFLSENRISRKRVPALIYGETNGTKWRRPANETDFALLEQISGANIPEAAPKKSIHWGELHRSGYHEGITHLHHFYTDRNFRVMSELWNAASAYDEEISDALKLWILSYNETHSTLMTRVVAKKNSKDLVLSGAQSGVLYISNLPVEKNILKGLSRKVNSFENALHYMESCSGHVVVHNSSSTEIFEDSATIDYIFTDPPFGDFIPYSEVNQINELWLSSVTNKKDEAIVSKSQKKDVSRYGSLLSDVFAGCSRVLKDDGLMTLVFHSSKAEIWNALAEAIDHSGLVIQGASYLNKKQSSFKQIVSAGSVKNDSLFLLTKAENLNQFPKETVSGGCCDDPKLAYTRYVNERMLAGATIGLDAVDAYSVFGKGNKDDE